MGFLGGRVTFVRYRAGGPSPSPFGPDLLEQVETHAVGRWALPEAKDGVQFGWAGGDHVLDLSFDLEKNVLNDALHIGMRIDTDTIPGALLRAYTKIETDARARGNPSGFPTRAQRAEAKEAARIRAEAEAADGRFRRLKYVNALWDGPSNTLFAGTTSASVLDRLKVLFRETFDRDLEPVTAGTLARDLIVGMGRADALEGLRPLGLIGDGANSQVESLAWGGADPDGRDYLGNEFLLWLWHTLQAEGDAVPLSDGSDVVVMMAKTLTLDCPRGQTGRDQLSDEGPTRMPEAFRALQAGKLPRKAGLILVRHGIQYEFTLQAESLAVSGLALPKSEGASGREASETRIDHLRHAVETLDLLYSAFLARRLDAEWGGELGRIRDWLRAA